MSSELRTAQERIRRFERLGGVTLSSLEPEQRSGFASEIHIGLANYKKAIFKFECPACGNRAESDQEMPPACTGPSWTDDHPLEAMQPVLGELFV